MDVDEAPGSEGRKPGEEHDSVIAGSRVLALLGISSSEESKIGLFCGADSTGEDHPASVECMEPTHARPLRGQDLEGLDRNDLQSSVMHVR